ncbi:hypothetical protein AVEN_268103-1, partial [Araneus ventricosus]
MDLPKFVAWMTATPWLWIMMKFVVFPDLFDLIPLVILGYLLILLNRAFRKDDLQMKRDAFTQTEVHLCEEKCTQTVYEENNASTQIEKIQFLEKSTQAAVIQRDAFTQIDKKEFDIKSTESVFKLMQDKDVQTSFPVYESKESQTSGCLLSDKEVQTEIIPSNSCKVFVPLKKQKPKPTIPLTKEFRKYHQNK